MRTSTRISLILLVLALLAGLLYFRSELHRVRNGLVGRSAADTDGDAAIAKLRADQLVLREELEAAKVDLGRSEHDRRSLESKIQSEVGRRSAIENGIDAAAEALRKERERHNREIWETRQFMPEGVRLAILAINECLRADGHDGLRFFRATKIENADKVLHGVQVIDWNAEALSSTLYLAARVSFDLDRAKGQLNVRFFEGFSRDPKGRVEFPDEGFVLSLKHVDGQLWERRLPYLVKGRGDYPVQSDRVSLPVMDGARRESWRTRVNALLAKADTSVRYKIDAFRDLQNARFLDALVVGYDDKKRLAMSVEAKRLWVQIDERSGAVDLRMEEGVLRKQGGETTIPEDGYRIQLPGVKSDQALEDLLGMVIRK